MKAAPLLLGLAAAAAVTAEAEGCRYPRPTYLPGNSLAEYIRQPGSVALARVARVEPLPVEERQYGIPTRTYRYTFEMVESLSGPTISSFTFDASRPIADISAYACGAQYDDPAQRQVSDRVCLSEQGHEGWEALNFRTSMPSTGGIGGFSELPEGDERMVLIRCGGEILSFAEGEAHLVFLDEDGSVRPVNELNFRLIRSEDDDWLETVRYFLANPDEERLPPRRAEDVAALLYPTVAGDCSDTNRFGCAPGQDARWFRFDGRPDSLVEPFAVIVSDDMVDLSGIPTQFEIEPEQVPLDDFNAWIAAHD
ncbi:hypothetical protein L5876_07850 [Hyphobacterium sp. SN044]|uniref:hypothetical protein n=1 Tax=Hyphobacterium sp. SN044 TaxID=2912575 RepID=UPI001F29AB17|nr:hypothetical protein [Hyphobacterium sp. SN044]MCF8879722.1 hypothetical protein [Hyphobacterium sp. SN044]